MIVILCPFCDQEIELDRDLSGEYLCPMCDETLLYENMDMIDKPIVLGKYHNFFTIGNIVGATFIVLLSISTFGIFALIVVLWYIFSESANRRETNRRRIAGDPYPEKISAYGIRIDVNQKARLLHWRKKKHLEFYPSELTSIVHVQRYYPGRFRLLSSILNKSLDFTSDKDVNGSIKIFLNDSFAGSITELTTKQGVEICHFLQDLYGVPHSVERQVIITDSGGGGSGGGGG